MTVRFQRDWRAYKAGQVAEIGDGQAAELMRRGVVIRVAVAPKKKKRERR